MGGFPLSPCAGPPAPCPPGCPLAKVTRRCVLLALAPLGSGEGSGGLPGASRGDGGMELGLGTPVCPASPLGTVTQLPGDHSDRAQPPRGAPAPGGKQPPGVGTNWKLCSATSAAQRRDEPEPGQSPGWPGTGDTGRALRGVRCLPLALPGPVLLSAAWHGCWVLGAGCWARGAGWAVGNSADPSRNGRRAGAGEGLSCRRLGFPNSASASDPRRPPGSACARVRGRWGLLARPRGLGTVLSHRHGNPTGTRPTGESRCRPLHRGWHGLGRASDPQAFGDGAFEQP